MEVGFCIVNDGHASVILLPDALIECHACFMFTALQGFVESIFAAKTTLSDILQDRLRRRYTIRF